MGVYNSSGTRVTRANVPATAYSDPDPLYTITDTLTRLRVFPGEEGRDASEGRERQVLADAGQRVRRSQIDSWFPTATVTSISPLTGVAAGGTVVTIKGTNLDGATVVNFGGNAGTAMTVVDTHTITVTTPAHAVGVVDVVITDDSGTITQTGGFTYQ